MERSANLAAEFYVASMLYRKGYTALLTYGHTKEIDLVVVNENGKTVTIDAKGLKNKTNWVLKPRKKKDHFYVLVCYLDRFWDVSTPPEVFVIPSMEIDRVLSTWAGAPDVTCVAYKTVKNSKYRDAWNLLFQ